MGERCVGAMDVREFTRAVSSSTTFRENRGVTRITNGDYNSSVALEAHLISRSGAKMSAEKSGTESLHTDGAIQRKRRNSKRVANTTCEVRRTRLCENFRGI